MPIGTVGVPVSSFATAESASLVMLQVTASRRSVAIPMFCLALFPLQRSEFAINLESLNVVARGILMRARLRSAFRGGKQHQGVEL